MMEPQDAQSKLRNARRHIREERSLASEFRSAKPCSGERLAIFTATWAFTFLFFDDVLKERDSAFQYPLISLDEKNRGILADSGLSRLDLRSAHSLFRRFRD
jgi:hypothetical protein